MRQCLLLNYLQCTDAKSLTGISQLFACAKIQTFPHGAIVAYRFLICGTIECDSDCVNRWKRWSFLLSSLCYYIINTQRQQNT